MAMSILWLTSLLLGSFALLKAEECASANGNLERSEIDKFENNANEFVLQLFRNGRTDQPNLVFSPTSIAVTLGMLLEGASGQTKTEIVQALGQNVNEQNLAKLFNRLVSRVNENSADYELSTANRIFVKDSFDISSDYKQKLEQCFDATAEPIDVSQPTETAEKINSWVADRTNQKITDLIDASAIQPNLALVLVNAIYFKAEWQTPFDTDNGGHTRAMDFNLLDGSSKQTDFMTMKNEFLYFENNDVQVLAIPYKSGTLHMFVFLPKENGFNNFESSVTRENLTELMDGVQQENTVQVSLPKFKVEAEFPLETALKAIGMRTMFSGNADFSPMGANLKVSEAKHKAVIEVNEKGTEAAAATYISVSFKSLNRNKKYFTANRPFLFAIRHNPTKSLLFFGRITDPTE